MDDARRRTIEDLFDQAADHPSSEWRNLLTDACKDDPSLIDDVLALLEADRQNPTVLRQNAIGLASTLFQGSSGREAPKRFGHYIVRQYLGQGGMGSVYLADREGLGDRVAVKFLHEPMHDPWSSSPAARDFFTREQQTLARLSHRYIARLYDAGIAEGTPWFAMEYVEGFPINEYCRSKRLGLGDRLQLFRCAAEAVGYAHRNLIVHLDLKPSNILVNAEGEVKLVDFGIARHLPREGVEAKEDVSGFLSINYAAPEQMQQAPADVQMDVYALGVVLWELLGGRIPVDATDKRTSQLFNRELPPPSPAARETPQPDVRASQAEWKDLDLICATATDRERERRYASVDALMQDLERFLTLKPLTAHPPSFTYKWSKYLRRNRAPLSVVAAVFITIATLTTFFTIRLIASRDRALTSEARTQRIYQLMLNLFGGDDSSAGPSQQLRVVSLLDRGVRGAEKLGQEPDVQAELRSTLGGLYHRLGHFDRAEPLLRSAWQAHRLTLGEDNSKTIDDELALARLYLDQSRVDEAERLARDALRLARRHNTNESLDVARASAALGKVLAARDDYQHAIPTLEHAVKVLSKGPESEDLSEALSSLANSQYSLGHIAESEALNLKALALDRRIYGDANPNTGIDLYNLGNIQLDRANYAEAERLFRQSLEIDQGWYDGDHPKTASAFLMVGRSLSYQGRSKEALAFYKQALSETRATYGENHPRYGAVLSLMGDLALQRHEIPAAERSYLQAAAIFRQSLGAQHEYYLHQLSNLATVQIAEKRYSAAESMLRPTLAHLKAIVPDQRYTALAEVRLSAALAGQKRYTEAVSYALAGYQHLKRLMGPSAVELQDAKKQLTEIYLALHDQAKATALQAELATSR